MSGFDGIEQFDGAKCAPSDWTQEGYPGIAHDFERTKQQRDALNAEHVNLRKQFYALAGAVGWSHERCAQTGDSPLDCAHGLRVQLATAQDQLAHEIAMHSLTSDALTREKERVREFEECDAVMQAGLDSCEALFHTQRERAERAEAALAEAQRENQSLREQLAAMVEQPDYSSGPIDEHCSITPAHPSVAAAVALAVERCAKVCEVGPIPDSVRKFMPEKVEALLALSAAHDKILALAPTLTTEAEAMREDAERYRKACASDTEDK